MIFNIILENVEGVVSLQNVQHSLNAYRMVKMKKRQ